MIKLNGPDLDSFDAQPAMFLWWKYGPRSRRPSSQPYGSGKGRPESETTLMTDSSGSESDSDADNWIVFFGMYWFVYIDHVELKKHLSLGDQNFFLATNF